MGQLASGLGVNQTRDGVEVLAAGQGRAELPLQKAASPAAKTGADLAYLVSWGRCPRGLRGLGEQAQHTGPGPPRGPCGSGHHPWGPPRGAIPPSPACSDPARFSPHNLGSCVRAPEPECPSNTLGPERMPGSAKQRRCGPASGSIGPHCLGPSLDYLWNLP